jgi:hypothetical protein
MREFSSFGAFADHLLTLVVAETAAMRSGLELIGQHVEKTSQEEIGHYQSGIGPFTEWQALADSTEAEKSRLGFPSGAPLLRTGDLRDSIGHEVDGLSAVIGSTSDVMVYQEMGTPSIPPRAVLGPAVLRNEEPIRAILGAAVISGMLGKDKIDVALGYDGEV